MESMFDLAVFSNEEVAHVLMTSHRDAQLLTNILKCMTEHSMPHVVYECGRESYMSLMIPVMKASGLYMTFNDSH